MHIEIELKLRVDPEDASKIAQHSLVAQYATQGPKCLDLKTTYFDTENFSLRQNGFALRIREQEGQLLQTVKTGGKSIGNLRERKEWEQKVNMIQPDLSVVDEEVRMYIKTILFDAPLKPIFHTQFKRTLWLLKIDDNQFELAFDQGHIEAQGRREALSEIELELINGDPACLEKAAESLSQDIPVLMEKRSKSSRGYRLCYAIIS